MLNPGLVNGRQPEILERLHISDGVMRFQTVRLKD